jgi:amidase
MKSSLTRAFATMAEAIEALRTKEVSARQLLEMVFERIDRHNPELNALVWENRDEARDRAARADESLARGRTLGPLHGIPVTIKEAFAYRGSTNSWGVEALSSLVSPKTAIAVERLESAGAIVVGKTNVPVLLGDWQTHNSVYGLTKNPHDVTRTPGGSTGGGAAALAAGIGYLSLGTDLAGSLRIPAHFCGVYAHKPSLGLVSTEGLQPGPWDGAPGYPMDISVVGPMARSAADLAAALDVLGGPELDHAKAWSWQLPKPRQRRLKDFRVGYVVDDPTSPLASDIRDAYNNLLSTLSRAGTQLKEGWPSGIEPHEQINTFQYLLMSLVTVEADDREREQARERLQRHPDDVAAVAMAGPHARWLHETRRRLAFRARWQQYFEQHDVFLMPTTFTAAFPHDVERPIEQRVIETPEGSRPYLELPTWISFASVAGLPATAAPIGSTKTGLPVGIQIVGPMWEDHTSIEFATLLADAVGGFVPPSAFDA